MKLDIRLMNISDDFQLNYSFSNKYDKINEKQLIQYFDIYVGGLYMLIIFTMSQLQNLTKTLIQVVGSLQQLISKKGTSQTFLQPEAPKLKKTPQMTYNQFVKKALANKKPIEVTNKKSGFRLQEDLELLSELSNHNQISIKTFEQISKNKKINRTTEALRSRYHDFLYRIDEKQMKKIVAWIEREGVEGYVFWEDDEMKIQLNDPLEKKQDKKRQRTTETQARKHEKISKKSKTVPTNCKQLNEVLKLYSKMVNIPIRTLVQKLDQLSGDLVQLDNYIETKDARMLWTHEEDEILRKGGPELQILRRYRGQGVETRRKYLGL